MEHNIIEIQIFVSCPGDVVIEKKAVEEICDRINTNMIDIGCNIRLAFRDFSEIIGRTGVRPQQLINESITGYNIYLGILFMRFGTPTGATNPNSGDPFESGTEEEFVIASNKKLTEGGPSEIYLFFKDQIGCKTSAEIAQAGKVMSFKEGLMQNNWVNGFDATPAFEKRLMDLLTRFSTKLCLEQIQQTKKSNIEEVSAKTDKYYDKVDFLSFVPTFTEIPHYIPRSISEPQQLGLVQSLLFREENKKPILRDLLVQEKRIAILGNAGSGKSVELQEAAKYYQDPSTPFIPIYKRFNTYTEESIEGFLPDGWDNLDPEVIALFLDGLDEIQPQHFNTAVRKLIDFSERNPKLRIVVSCRTNFYELPNETFSGTLTGFKVFILDDITLPEIRTYTAKLPNLDWDKFIRDVYDQSYLDLIQKPFFLDILINYYIKKGSFIGGRSSIIEDSLISMIDFDKEHFKSSINIPKSKKVILSLLERVAFVMEVMGKNFITDEELETILSSKDELNQIKYFSAFAKNLQKNVWMFEHNNIQEFLAAKVLAKQSFEKLIEIISFPSAHNKIKQTWTNTLSFFISTSEPGLRKDLINWLVDKDQEIIVKFEPDRVDKDLRIQIFKEIFNFYKEKNIWLTSNKFNNNELVRFASFPETIEFLINQIQEKLNSRTVKLNAIGLVDNFPLAIFSNTLKEKVKEVLINFLNNEESDPYMIHQGLYALANLEITDQVTIEHFVKKYAKRKNQYVRAGLYKLINSSDYLEQFADLFLDGFNLAEMEDATDDRENTNLMDESWQLREGLIKMKSPTALKKLLSNLKSREERRRINKYDNKDVVEAILKNAFEAYNNDASMFNDIYDVYITAGREYDTEYALMIIPFFEKTQTKWNTFLLIWKDEAVKDYDKALLLELLLDENIINRFIDGYKNRDFNNEDAEFMHRILAGNFASSDQNMELTNHFEDELLKLGCPKFERPIYPDWTTINKDKAQRSFDLLFSKEEMLNEIKSIFSELGKDIFTNDDLWQLHKDYYKEIDDYFISSALELLRDFTTHDRTVTYSQVEAWVLDSNKFDVYQINKIYQEVHNNRNAWITISKAQADFIISWCLRTANELDIANAVKSDKGSTHIDWKSIRLWYFLNQFNIPLSENKLLDFTLYYDFETANNSDPSEIIIKIESFISKDKIEQKVVANLAAGISEVQIWKSNAAYAIKNNLTTAFLSIWKALKNADFRDYYREEVLELLFNKTQDYSAMQEMLKTIGKDEIRWKVIKLIVDNEDPKAFLLDYLKGIIASDTEIFDSKMKAARYLTQLNDMVGFRFATSHILESKDPSFDFHYRFETAIKDPDAIPILIDLMKLAKQPEFQKDHFNSLENYVLDALYHMGIQSEDNFLLVKTAIEKFIEENKAEIKHLDFLFFNIRKIEEQLYLKKSQDYTVVDALNEYNELNN
ncbi:MAG: hypothetical protein ABJB11_10395 [Ferruginibacter sp.]